MLKNRCSKTRHFKIFNENCLQCCIADCIKHLKFIAQEYGFFKISFCEIRLFWNNCFQNGDHSCFWTLESLRLGRFFMCLFYSYLSTHYSLIWAIKKDCKSIEWFSQKTPKQTKLLLFVWIFWELLFSCLRVKNSSAKKPQLDFLGSSFNTWRNNC